MDTRITTALAAWILGLAALLPPAAAGEARQGVEAFRLLQAVPEDVFLCVAERRNPERDFVRAYWREVFEELKSCGVQEDLAGLFSGLFGSLDERERAELERLKERVLTLLEGVHWSGLDARESIFLERFHPPGRFGRGSTLATMPDMVWAFRGTPEGAAENYEGLCAILEALVEEINRAAGSEALHVKRTADAKGTTVSVNFFEPISVEQALPLSLALRGDVIVIGLRERLFRDVAALLDGEAGVGRLVETPRFKEAFAGLPPAEDSLTFFDMQAMVRPMREAVETLLRATQETRDVYRNAAVPPEVNGFHKEAMSAYRGKKIEKALELERKALERAPGNSLLLYNLACFNALAGDREKALQRLEEAVEAGWYAPGKIAGDGDLAPLREDPRYAAALERAGTLAAEARVKDHPLNAECEGEVMRLRMQARQAREKGDYEQALELLRQAHAAAPQNSLILYVMACMHVRLGHRKEGLDYLEKAVQAGFYCPRHISTDPDLESVRDDPRFRAALEAARTGAAEETRREKEESLARVKSILDTITNAMGLLDYSAEVGVTEGYRTETVTYAALAPDAKERPIYPVFAKKAEAGDFHRFLPVETESFSLSTGIDLDALYTFLEEAVRGLGPKGERLLQRWEGVQKAMGMDVRRDVLGWIEGDTVTVTLSGGKGSVFLLKVKDEKAAREKVRAAIGFLSSGLAKMAREKPELTGPAMMLNLRTSPVKHEGLEGFQNLFFSMSPKPIVWGTAEGHLLFGTSAEAAALCLETARGAHPDIRKNERAMKEALLPDGPFTALSLTDRRRLGAEIQEGLGAAAMVSGMLGAFVPDPKVKPVLARIAGIIGKLAPVAEKIDFYKSKASVTVFDGRGWRTRCVTHYFSPEERAERKGKE